MFDISPHFLDTNILLGKILPNEDNSNSICQLYFDHECERYISKRVENESKNVINKFRRISLKFLNHFQSYIGSNNINPMKIDSFLHYLKKEFFNKYKNEDFPEGVKKEKFNNIIEDLFDMYNTVFREEFLSYTNKIEGLKRNTIDAFKIYSKNLNILINILNNGEFYNVGGKNSI